MRSDILLVGCGFKKSSHSIQPTMASTVSQGLRKRPVGTNMSCECYLLIMDGLKGCRVTVYIAYDSLYSLCKPKSHSLNLRRLGLRHHQQPDAWCPSTYIHVICPTTLNQTLGLGHPCHPLTNHSHPLQCMETTMGEMI